MLSSLSRFLPGYFITAAEVKLEHQTEKNIIYICNNMDESQKYSTKHKNQTDNIAYYMISFCGILAKKKYIVTENRCEVAKKCMC